MTISKNDKPYLSLGADLTPDQRATVLGFMGIELTDLDKYDVVYVNNDEEHKYLDSYISKSEIGTRSLSSVLITEDKKGAGLSVSKMCIRDSPYSQADHSCRLQRFLPE